MLAALRTPDGAPLDLTLTTNGSILARKAQALKDAGLRRVTVSLDALDDAIFRRMNDVDFPVADVLAAMARRRPGPIKVNMVVKRGTNDHEIVAMARHFRGSGIVLRFIEYMDVGEQRLAHGRGVPSAQVVERIDAVWAAGAAGRVEPGETAQRWRYRDGGGEIGVVSERDPGVLPRLQPRPPVHRGQALPVPVRDARPRPARAAARRLHRRADRGGDRPYGSSATTVTRAAQRPGSGPAQRRRTSRSAASRCTTSAVEGQPVRLFPAAVRNRLLWATAASIVLPWTAGEFVKRWQQTALTHDARGDDEMIVDFIVAGSIFTCLSLVPPSPSAAGSPR